VIKSPVVDLIMAELSQAGDNKLHAEIHIPIKFIWSNLEKSITV
jgi:hypothetical protein